MVITKEGRWVSVVKTCHMIVTGGTGNGQIAAGRLQLLVSTLNRYQGYRLCGHESRAGVISWNYSALPYTPCPFERLTISAMEVGGMTSVSEVFKVTPPGPSCGGLAALEL